ncbi:MAG: thioredoxin family protein [Bacteroidota bacterium]|nr:thioredoxin family protein [Bacteroidota bacterium]
MSVQQKIHTSIIILLLLLHGLSGRAQQAGPVTFHFDKSQINAQEVLLTIKAKVDSGVKLYSIDKLSDDVPSSSVQFDSSSAPHLAGPVTEKSVVKEEKDSNFNTVVKYISDSAIWQQRVKVQPADSFVLKGAIGYMYKKGDEYIPAEEPIRVLIKTEPMVASESTTGTTDGRSLLWIFLTAFAGGLLALITPCVYSMIPVTVSFFTKRSKSRQEGIQNAVWYSASIIIIFTLLGFLITIIFGPAALNNLATNWIANLVFFAIFLIFGISFLGAFDITLPASWSSKADAKAGLGNFTGVFFMALTLVLVSFSCTGPIIGNLLVLAAKGSYFGPLVGMFGFSLALALPFALFAFFPSKLNVLGKAGGWLNAVKVTLGFLELALALKFLSNADLARGWRLLDREVFLSLWIVLFLLLGIYLLGKIRFHHDDGLPKNDFGLPYISIPRLFFAIATLAFTMYMIPGLWGAPLKGISAFVPPMGTQDFNASAVHREVGNTAVAHGNESGLHPQKYVDQMKIYEPEVVTKYGLITFFDYNEALETARRLKRPLMLDFTGINCVNCRKMEGQVWSDPQVMQRLKEDFVVVSLYVDVHHIDLQENEQYYSDALGKKVVTLGDKYADLQVTRFSANVQPYYFFLDGREQRLLPEGYGYDPDIRKFINLLEKAKEEYKRRSA